MLACAFEPGEAVRRCACGNVMVARVGDTCRCGRFFADPAAIHDALVTLGDLHGPAEVARIAPVLGVEGERYFSNGERVFGVVGGGR